MDKNNQNFLGVSILISAILISGTIFYTNSKNNNLKPGQGASNQDQNNLKDQIADVGNVNLEGALKIKPDDVILGNPDAPVTIIEYSDYECPFCEMFFNQTEISLRKDYIETGKVKMIYRDFPLESHKYAMPAALAANCAKESGKFWAYHDEIFKNQNNLASFNYIQTAKKLGIDELKFKSCFDSKKYSDQIKQNFQEALSIGVQGTPTFFINGQKIVGAQPYSVFKNIIEQELNKK